MLRDEIVKIPHLVRDGQFKSIISQMIAAEGCISRIEIRLKERGQVPYT